MRREAFARHSFYFVAAIIIISGFELMGKEDFKFLRWQTE